MCLNINWGNLQPLTVTGSFELSAFFLCLEVEGCRFVPELVCTFHVTWGKSVHCSVMIILAEYVLCLQFNKRQQIISRWSRVLEKLTFAHLVKKFPVHSTFFFVLFDQIVSHASHSCKCQCCRRSKFSSHLVIKLFWLGYSLCFFTLVLLCQPVKIIFHYIHRYVAWRKVIERHKLQFET